MRFPRLIAAVAGTACCAGLVAGGRPAAAMPLSGLLIGHDRAVGSGGIWGKATEVPRLGALNTGDSATVVSVSCASDGNCAAGGSYLGKSGKQGFVVSERNGTWGKATEVRRQGAVHAGGNVVISVSCGSAGNCAAGGSYTDSSGHGPAFIATERSRSWGKARAVAGLAALNTGGMTSVRSVSCASAGNCVAVGD